MPQYSNREELFHRYIWASNWPALIMMGMLEPEDMPDTLTADKAGQIKRIWNDFQDACGQMYMLIKPKDHDG